MQPKNPLQLALYYAFPFVLIITTLFLVLLFWEKRNLEDEQQVELTQTASALLQQIIVTRLWNAEHGGVYAEITEKTRPNPFLDARDRDMVSIDGKRYTKLNPAYMTRQIADLAGKHLGYGFHITSLKPVNPANAPDPWEREALQSFEHGDRSRQTVVREPEPPLFRYMVPLPTEESCLACHAKQRYQVGDVRGGISVSVPMTESDRIYEARKRTYLAAGAALWLSMMVFVLLVSYTLSRKVVADMERQLEFSRLRTAVELAGAAAHEIRQPLTALITYFDILKMRLAKDAEVLKELDSMILQCRRIDDMLKRMQNITEYRTKTYIGDIRITDLDKVPPTSRRP